MIPAESTRVLSHTRLLLAVTALHAIGLVSGLVLPARDAMAQPAPAAGMFLVASRDLRGSGFAETVILIIQHDADGTMGLIINQPTHTNPAELLSDVAGLENYPGKLFVGGPVAAWGVIMLLHSDPTPTGAKHIFGDVYTSGDRELLSQLVRSDAAAQVRLYAGHAGWLPGQLDAEIRRGSWIVMPANAKSVFSAEPRKIWRRLIQVSNRLVVKTTDEAHQKYTYNAMSPRIIPIRSGHFSSAMP